MAERPVDITCRVTRHWRPDPQGPDLDKKIPIKKGQTGVVFKRQGGGALISLDVVGDAIAGWVPGNCIEDGVPKDQPITFVALDLPAVSPAQLPPVPAGTSKLDKALTAALRSYRADTILERISKEDAKFIQNDNHIASLVKATLTGMPNDVRHLLEDGTTSIKDFSQLKQMDDADYEEGVYLLVHIWEDGTIGLYIGTSQSLTERVHAHKTGIAGQGQPNNLHYTFARSIQNRRLLEQTFVLLLGTYGDKMLSPEALTTNVDFSHYYLFQEDATVLNLTAIRLSDEVGWTQFRLRRGFVGLNTASPITETHSYSDRPIWTKTYYPEMNMMIFRRPKLMIGHELILFGPGGPTIAVRNSTLQSGATHAHCSVEIMTNGRPHEVPYARLERLGPYSNWLQMHEIGMAMTYQKPDGQWFKEYHQIASKVRSSGKKCARLGYEFAMIITTLLSQVEWFDPPDFLEGVVEAVGNLYRPRIKEMVLDRLQHTITVRNLVTIRQVESPVRVPDEEISLALTGPPAHLRLRTAAGLAAQESHRKLCDFCHFNFKDGAGIATSRCHPSELPDRCSNCYVMGRPCTWNDFATITPAGEEVVYGRPTLNKTVYPIESPGFEEFGAGGESDDEERPDEVKSLSDNESESEDNEED